MRPANGSGRQVPNAIIPATIAAVAAVATPANTERRSRQNRATALTFIPVIIDAAAHVADAREIGRPQRRRRDACALIGIAGGQCDLAVQCGVIDFQSEILAVLVPERPDVPSDQIRGYAG